MGWQEWRERRRAAQEAAQAVGANHEEITDAAKDQAANAMFTEALFDDILTVLTSRTEPLLTDEARENLQGKTIVVQRRLITKDGKGQHARVTPVDFKIRRADVVEKDGLVVAVASGYIGKSEDLVVVGGIHHPNSISVGVDIDPHDPNNLGKLVGQAPCDFSSDLQTSNSLAFRIYSDLSSRTNPSKTPKLAFAGEPPRLGFMIGGADKTPLDHFVIGMITSGDEVLSKRTNYANQVARGIHDATAVYFNLVRP